MHYFTYGQDFAAVENADQAAKYRAAGWCPVSHDAFIDAWRRRDARDWAALWGRAMPVMVTAPLRNWMPSGYLRYHM